MAHRDARAWHNAPCTCCNVTAPRPAQPSSRTATCLLAETRTTRAYRRSALSWLSHSALLCSLRVTCSTAQGQRRTNPRDGRRAAPLHVVYADQHRRTTDCTATAGRPHHPVFRVASDGSLFFACALASSLCGTQARSSHPSPSFFPFPGTFPTRSHRLRPLAPAPSLVRACHCRR